MKHLFDEVSLKTSKMVTKTYSTSFSLGIKFLNEKFHNPIYSIYGFVRLGDEIVDSFSGFDQEQLMGEFKDEVYKAIDRGISTNPILNSYQHVYHKYHIDRELVDLFIRSMEMDLDKKKHDTKSYQEYIVGSAEVVGLMCLKVFCEGDERLYEDLKSHAMSLGSAFQKINFLRDLNLDYYLLGRSYFPNLNMNDFSERAKVHIEIDIERDFRDGLKGIKKLPEGSRFGVYMAYIYFHGLFKKIQWTPSPTILNKRVRLSNFMKYFLFFNSYLKFKLNLI